MPINLYIAYGYFHVTIAALSTWGRELITCKPKIFTIWPILPFSLKAYILSSKLGQGTDDAL